MIDFVQDDVLNWAKHYRGPKFHAALLDGPYELSNDGKASAVGVFAEFFFPKQSEVYADSSSDGNLSILIDKVLDLNRGGFIPSPSATMPKVAMTLDNDISSGKINIKDGQESSEIVSDWYGLLNDETELSVDLGDFVLELADTSTLFNALDAAGCCFYAGGIGIGLRVSSSSLPSFLKGCGAINSLREYVGLTDSPFSHGVSASSTTEDFSVARFDLGGAFVDCLPASRALVFLSILNVAGAKLIRAIPTTSRLPSMLQSRRVCIINPTTNRAISFNLIIHNTIISSSGFMGKQWDGQKIAFDVGFWSALSKHLYDGAFIMAFGGMRTQHRMACAMEDAGLVIHNSIFYAFGSGFPKATRIKGNSDFDGHRYGLQALKPAGEIIIVAQKPYKGKPIDCITTTGAGALNVDAARIGSGDGLARNNAHGDNGWKNSSGGPNTAALREAEGLPALGRWPANFMLQHSPNCNGVCADDCPVKVLGEQSGESKSNVRKPTFKDRHGESGFVVRVTDNTERWHNDSGSAARFFHQSDWSLEQQEAIDNAAPFYYCAKSSTAERNAGLDGRNTHNTVKPLKLARYLATLLLPPVEYAPRRLLNPFAGSMSEAIGAHLAGFEEIVAIEREQEYVEIGKKRYHFWIAKSQEIGSSDPSAILKTYDKKDKAKPDSTKHSLSESLFEMSEAQQYDEHA